MLIRQAVSKDLTSSSKFSGSCVLTLQTLLISKDVRERKTSRRRTRMKRDKAKLTGGLII